MSNLVINDINIGQDLTLTFQTQSGQIIPASDLGLLLSFEAKQENQKLKVSPISHGGRPIFRSVPMGWNGNIMWARFNGNLSNLVAKLVNNFHESGQLILFNMQTSILNRDSTIDNYLWLGCSLSDHDFGKFEAFQEVEQGLSFQAQEMRQVGSGQSIYQGV